MGNAVIGDFFDRILEILKNDRKQSKMALNLTVWKNSCWN